MMPQQPSPTPAPIHDIVAPVGFFPYPLWQVAAVSLAVLAILGLLVWLTVRLSRRTRKPTPREVALRDLGALVAAAGDLDGYRLGIAASDVLRAYCSSQFDLRATTQTSLEFLESIRDHVAFSEDERALLARFLEAADLLKFARAEASSIDRDELIDRALRLVRGEAIPKVPEVRA